MARDNGWCAPRLHTWSTSLEMHSNIRLFANDTSLYTIVDFPDFAAQFLDLDPERLYA